MAVIKNSVWIERPVEEVFDYAVDMRNEREFNPDLQSIEKVTDGPVGVGTTYLAKWKQSQQIEVRCTGYDRPREWVYVNGGPVSVTLHIKVEPERGGTRLVSRFDAHPNGWFVLVFPVFLMIMRRAEKGVGLNLKKALEGGAAASSA